MLFSGSNFLYIDHRTCNSEIESCHFEETVYEPTVDVLITFFSAKLEINIEKAFALVVCAYVEL